MTSTAVKSIYLDAPNIGSLEKKYVNDALDSGFVSTFGPYVPQFEKRMAEYCGVKCAVAVQSGTAGLFMTLTELGIGAGDEVIVPSLTFAATVNAVLHCKATPVIVDVDQQSWCIDPEKIKQATTAKTKAIIPVHLYGNPCNMDAINTLADELNVFVIEDATESLGSIYKNQHAGTLADYGVLSFNGNKMITTGGGGMILSNDWDHTEHIRYLVNQAKDYDAPNFHSELGFNYRMTNIEAALGLAQLERLDEFLEKKRSFQNIYEETLADVAEIQFQKTIDAGQSNYWLSTITLAEKISIDEVINALAKEEIPTRKIFVPINQMPYLSLYKADCPEALKLHKCGLCLPSSTLNSEEDIKDVALKIKAIICQTGEII